MLCSYSNFCDVEFKTKRDDTNIFATAEEVMTNCEVIFGPLVEMIDFKIDLILYDVSAVWGKYLGYHLGVSSICCFPGLAPQWKFAFVSGKVSKRYVKESVSGISHLKHVKKIHNRIVKQFDINEAHSTTIFKGSDVLNIVFTSEFFQPYSDEMGNNYFFTGPCLSVRAGGANDFAWDRVDETKPLVYISMGTLYYQDPSFFTHCIKTFTDTNYQIIMSVGRETNIADLGEIPDNIVIGNYVPQLEILDRASAFITHGGMNGISEAIFYRTPMILMPKTIEQQMNAVRIEQLNAGFCMKETGNSEDILDNLEKLLNDEKYLQGVEEIRTSFVEAAGIPSAVDSIISKCFPGDE